MVDRYYSSVWRVYGRLQALADGAFPLSPRFFCQVHWTIGPVTAFYFLVMTLGYTYGACTGDVSDNILNDFG